MSEGKPGMGIKFAFGAFIALAAAVFTVMLRPGWGGWNGVPETALPRAGSITRMTAELSYTFDGPSAKAPLGPKVGPFAVPDTAIPKIMDALGPAKFDPNPAKWQELGKLDLTTRDGKEWTVDLYATGEPTGGFAVSDGAGNGRTYYRGGTDRAIMEVIRDANPPSLPEADDIEAMTAHLSVSPNVPGKPTGPFAVPAESIPRVLAAMTPATVDPKPANWESLGALVLTLKGGGLVEVSLYSTSEPPGAFSLGGSKSQPRTYFRGGDSKTLFEAIREARAASKAP